MDMEICPYKIHTARDRPSPYAKAWRYFFRSAGACLPRVSEAANDGEGQALALR